MNFQSKDPAQNQEQNSSISFRINRTSHGENRANPPRVEWARISPNKVIVANSEKAWLLEDTEKNAPENSTTQYFTQSMEGAGSIETTRQLLDGAISAAKYAVDSDARPPALTATRWVWRLAGAYHSSRFTSSLMEEAAKNFTASGRFNLADWALHKADEERGHDRLAFLDIQSMGYDAEAVLDALIPPGILTFMDYFTRSVKDSDPIDCVGCSYASERLGTFLGKEYIQSIQALLPKGINATRWLRVHSGVGAEVHHIKEIVEVVAKLTPQERVRVARACYETSLLRFSPPLEGYISDEKLRMILDPVRLSAS